MIITKVTIETESGNTSFKCRVGIDSSGHLIIRSMNPIVKTRFYEKNKNNLNYTGSEIENFYNKSFDRQLFSNDTEGLLNGYLYQDTNFETLKPISEIYRQKSVVPYKVFLWNRETSLSVGGNHDAKLKSDSGEDLDI